MNRENCNGKGYTNGAILSFLAEKMRSCSIISTRENRSLAEREREVKGEREDRSRGEWGGRTRKLREQGHYTKELIKSLKLHAIQSALASTPAQRWTPAQQDEDIRTSWSTGPVNGNYTLADLFFSSC